MNNNYHLQQAQNVSAFFHSCASVGPRLGELDLVVGLLVVVLDDEHFGQDLLGEPSDVSPFRGSNSLKRCPAANVFDPTMYFCSPTDPS